MRANDNQLLRDYLRDRSEAAFAELVERHLGLVYSAALRQVNGDAQAAEDIAQSVFIDLARKAPSLLRHSSLTGWLYTSTRYLSANARRAALRRRSHEETAQIMNDLLRPDAPELDWTLLRPALDDAMHDLNAADRDAVLWRYFEKSPFAEIGARLGLNENAARMRVERALERLRDALAKRGVTSSAAGLALMVANQAIGAVPAGLAQRVCQASAATVATGGVAVLISALLASSKAKIALGVVAAAAVLVLILTARHTMIFQPLNPPIAAASQPSNGAPAQNSVVTEVAAAPATNRVAKSAPPAIAQDQLQLKLVAADSGDVVPNAEIKSVRDVGSDTIFEDYHSDSAGVGNIRLSRKVVSLQLYIRVDGFAGTMVGWRPDRGEVIPSQYLVQLARAATLGGWVVDANGAPVAGATVEGSHPTDLDRATQREAHLAEFKATTDASGKWRSRQVAPELVRTLQLHARHPEHGSSATVDVESSVGIEGLLRAESYTLRLGPADEVSGRVVDPEQNPVSGASVLLGELYTRDSKRTKSAADGSFTLSGVPRGKRLITGNAEGFAATTVQIDAQPDSDPVQLVLSRGKSLSVKVVDLAGQPIVGAEVWINASRPEMQFNGVLPATQPTNQIIQQVAMDKKTDADGRVLFAHVPDTEVQVGTSAKGYMEQCGHRMWPGGDELILSLGPELIVTGTVTDGATGSLIPRFKMVVGQPGSAGVYWSTIDRFQMSFEGGSFRHALNEAADCTGTNSGYFLKFEAEGHAPFISRFIAPDERQVQLDIAMQPIAQRQLTVLNPDGTPAASADVGLLDVADLSRSSIPLIPGGLGRRFSRTDDAIRQADDQGHVQLPGEGMHRIVAASAGGYAEVDLSKLPDDIIRLQPWGRVEGILPVVEGQASMHEIQFQFQGLRGSSSIMAEFFSGYRLKPEKDGRFVLPLVPPGKHRIVELIPDNLPPEATMHTWQHGRSADVEVRAGETAKVTLVNGGKVN